MRKISHYRDDIVTVFGDCIDIQRSLQGRSATARFDQVRL